MIRVVKTSIVYWEKEAWNDLLREKFRYSSPLVCRITRWGPRDLCNLLIARKHLTAAVWQVRDVTSREFMTFHRLNYLLDTWWTMKRVQFSVMNPISDVSLYLSWKRFSGSHLMEVWEDWTEFELNSFHVCEPPMNIDRFKVSETQSCCWLIVYGWLSLLADRKTPWAAAGNGRCQIKTRDAAKRGRIGTGRDKWRIMKSPGRHCQMESGRAQNSGQVAIWPNSVNSLKNHSNKSNWISGKNKWFFSSDNLLMGSSIRFDETRTRRVICCRWWNDF